MPTRHSGRHSNFLIYQLGLPFLLGFFKKREKNIKFPIKLRKNYNIGWKKGTKKLSWKKYSKNTALKYFSNSGVFLKKISFLTLFPGLLTEAFWAAAIRIVFPCCIAMLLAAGTALVCNYFAYLPLSILNICSISKGKCTPATLDCATPGKFTQPNLPGIFRMSYADGLPYVVIAQLLQGVRECSGLQRQGASDRYIVPNPCHT